MMRYLNLLIKPASSLCDMRCRYCFYADESACRTQESMGLMSQETAELLIREAIQAVEPGGYLGFAFQGGEPTLAGLPFFRRFVSLSEQYNTKRLSIHWSIQTNGLHIDREWADFFKTHGFLVGISMDGDKDLHDGLRVDAQGKGTWNRVRHAVALLKGAGVELNLLCVVTRSCARAPRRVYRALKKTGIPYLQFIPCLDPLEEARGTRPYSLTAEDYGHFLCGLFDEWFRDWTSGRYTSVRLFDDYVHLAMGLPAGTCATGGRCGSYLVVEADGSLYPCDFYALDEWWLGLLGQAPLEEILCMPKAKRFVEESLKRPVECASCPWLGLCFGGCKRDWVQTPLGHKNYFCNAFRSFFVYAGPRLMEMAQAEAAARAGLPR